MKKITFLLFLTLAVVTFGTKAQNIQNGVLISWPMATGDIKIPDGVVEIAPNCFFAEDSDWGGDDGDGWGDAQTRRNTLRSANTEITSVDFNGVKKIGKEAFRECKGIQWVKMPNVEVIEESAFEFCDNPKFSVVNLPSVKSIGKNAFASCDALTTVTLGGKLESMGKNPFYNCSKISKFEITNKDASFKVVEDVVLSSDETKLAIVLPTATKVVLPETVTAILDGAGQSQKMLGSIKGVNVTSVGEHAFSSASSLEAVYLPKLQDVGFLAFSMIGGIKIMDIHESADFKSFGDHNVSGPADIDILSIYVANEGVKSSLSQIYKKAKIVVGEPKEELKKFTVTFSADPANAAFFDAWTNGPVDLNSGDQVSEGCFVKAECRYDFMHYEFVKWTVNGEDYSGDPKKPTLIEVLNVDKNLNIVAHLSKLPEGNRVYFKSNNTGYGQLTAKVDGKEIKSSDIVPTGKTVTFTAVPNKGYVITDWLVAGADEKYEEKSELKGKSTWTYTPTEELNVFVRFERTEGSVIISYSERSGNGKLSCKMEDGTPVADKEAIPSGKTLIFVAEPNPGFKVGTWIVGEEERAEKDKELKLENVISDIEVLLICYKEDQNDPDRTPVIEGDVLKSWNPVGNVRIPDKVKHIADHAFKGATLTGLTITSEVETIGELPFMYCGSLKTLIVEDGNKNFKSEDNAIYTKDGKELVQVATGYEKQTFSLPASVEKVRLGAFAFAMGIKTIEVDPDNKLFESNRGMLIRKADNALIHYPSFIVPNEKAEEIILPNDIRKIEKYACAFNFKFNKLTLPDNLEELADYAFMGSANLQDISFANCTKLKRVGDFCFKACFRLPQFNVPGSGLEYIGEQALQGSAIVLLNVPKDVKIGANAFRGCQSIAQVNSFGSTPPALDDPAFSDIAEIGDAKLFVPVGAKNDYAQASGWKAFKNIIESETLSTEAVTESGAVFTVTDGLVHISNIIDARVDVYDLSGEMLQTVKGKGDMSIRLDRGSYIIVVTDGAGRIVKKIIL